jgi:fructose-1,6-bisphosphatase/inositol monophosphatase family enzyme
VEPEVRLVRSDVPLGEPAQQAAFLCAKQGLYMNCARFQRMIRVIDIAASCLILREAGGEVVDLTGEKLDMDFDLKDRKNFLAYGDPRIKELVLRGSE